MVGYFAGLSSLRHSLYLTAVDRGPSLQDLTDSDSAFEAA
jgi:hypothetical protein